ncbi:MAG: hypothetical protein WCR21_07645 [Bacteroidota bacterium]
MKRTAQFILFFLLLIFVACITKKKTNSTQTTTNQSQAAVKPSEPASGGFQNAAPSVSNYPFPMVKLPVFNYEPTEAHVVAMQSKYPQLDSISLTKLESGHRIYNSGACIKCHAAKDVLAFDELKWAIIIGDMSMRAHLADIEKDALVKYILAIKAIPSNGNK